MLRYAIVCAVCRLVAEALKIDKATLSAMTSVQYSPFLLEKARWERLTLYPIAL